jgi:uncharacterized membrane protein YeaQ/YmgE (transglycosylase-associated protein family)
VINVIVWIMVGGLLGWIASLIMRTDAQPGMLLNIMVGIVGAALAGLVLSPLFGMGAINQNHFSLASLAISLAGAVSLLDIVNMFRPNRVRKS